MKKLLFSLLTLTFVAQASQIDLAVLKKVTNEFEPARSSRVGLAHQVLYFELNGKIIAKHIDPSYDDRFESYSKMNTRIGKLIQSNNDKSACLSKTDLNRLIGKDKDLEQKLNGKSHSAVLYLYNAVMKITAMYPQEKE